LQLMHNRLTPHSGLTMKCVPQYLVERRGMPQLCAAVKAAFTVYLGLVCCSATEQRL